MVTLVVTSGESSLDTYAQELAKRLPRSKIYTNYFQTITKSLNLLLPLNLMKNLLNDWRVVRFLNSQNAILHFPHQHFGRFGHFLQKPFIITCHDLLKYFDLKRTGMFFQNPTFLGKIYLSLDFSGMKKARKIIAVSKYTKHDLVTYLGIPEEKIEVIYQGVDLENFKPESEKTRRRKNSPYLLYVGAEIPRKNFAGILKAFKSLKADHVFRNFKLVKVGNASSGWSREKYRNQSLDLVKTLGLENEVIFTGFVDKKELVSYYAGAECFVFPSFYEGFGLPPLEAMACGCPVVTSNSSSLPEVMGNAGLLVDPHNVDEIVAAITKVLTNGYLRNSLRRAGLERAKQFSWQKTAEATLRVYQEVEKTSNDKI